MTAVMTATEAIEVAMEAAGARSIVSICQGLGFGRSRNIYLEWRLVTPDGEIDRLTRPSHRAAWSVELFVWICGECGVWDEFGGYDGRLFLPPTSG
jgi:hypothetical protein